MAINKVNIHDLTSHQINQVHAQLYALYALFLHQLVAKRTSSVAGDAYCIISCGRTL